MSERLESGDRWHRLRALGFGASGEGPVWCSSPSILGRRCSLFCVNVPRGVTAKLRRAGAHLATFRAAVEEFLAADPFAADRSVRCGGRAHVISWIRTEPIPEEILLLAGDTVHNLRTALDHLAVEIERLSAQRSGHTLSSEDERRPQFPAARNKREFGQQIKRFSYLDASAIETLKTFQPFVIAPSAPEQSFLWQVSDLDNLDKHRMLAPIPISPVMITRHGHRGRWVDGPSVPYAVGVEIGRFEFDDPTSVAEMPIQFHYGLTLGTSPWIPHNAHYRLAEYVTTVADGIIAPICSSLNL